MKFDDTAIINQNLLRCCVKTLLEIGDNSPNAEFGNGDIINCKKGGRTHRMFLWNGVWQWIDPRSAELNEKNRINERGGLLDRLRRR